MKRASFASLAVDTSNARPYPLKRFLDVALATTLFVVLLPLLGMIAVAILIEDGDVPFTWVYCAGRNDTRFRRHRFRVGVPGSDSFFRPVDFAPDDDRLSRVGGWLLRWGLRDVPGLWNVIRGDMSLVGPAPHAASESELLRARLPRYAERWRFSPGLVAPTCLAAPGMSAPERLRFDTLYIQKMSLSLDAWMLTVAITRAATRQPHA